MESKFKESSNLPKVQIKSPDGVHGEVWIDGQNVRGVRRIDFSMDAERVPAQEVILHLMANVDIETCAVPKFSPFDLIPSDSFWERLGQVNINTENVFDSKK